MPLVTATPFSDLSFSPIDIPALVLWIDFSDISTLFQDLAGSTPVTANGQTINRANDKSGFNSDMNAVNAVTGPTWNSTGQNGIGISSFAGTPTDDALTTLSLSLILNPFTMLIAGETPKDATGTSVLTDNLGCGGGRPLIYTPAGLGQPVTILNNTTLATTLPWGAFTTITIESKVPSSTSNIYQNTSIDTTGDIGGVGFGSLQLAQACNGLVNGSSMDVGEVLIYNNTLTAPQLAQVQNYLIAKWGT